jgi:hypothetical protein
LRLEVENPFRSNKVMKMASILALGIVAVSAVACERMRSPTSPAAALMLAEGHWASGQMCLDVTSSFAKIGAGCGSGTLPRPVSDATGSFDAQGTFDVTGGPPPPSQQQPTVARFSGVVRGDTLTLTITTAHASYGPFAATRGSPMGCPVACP